jgi:hypothetical protein
MPDEEFGSFLGKNLKAVKFGKDGGIEIPIRANERDGVAFGVDAIAENERAHRAATASESDPSVPRRSWWRRLVSRS